MPGGRAPLPASGLEAGLAVSRFALFAYASLVSKASAADQAESAGFDAVFVYTARPEHHHPAPPADAIVIRSYLRTVEAAFEALGRGQLDLFRATTAAPPVEVADATLVRNRIPEGNPRDW